MVSVKKVDQRCKETNVHAKGMEVSEKTQQLPQLMRNRSKRVLTTETIGSELDTQKVKKSKLDGKLSKAVQDESVIDQEETRSLNNNATIAPPVVGSIKSLIDLIKKVRKVNKTVLGKQRSTPYVQELKGQGKAKTQPEKISQANKDKGNCNQKDKVTQTSTTVRQADNDLEIQVTVNSSENEYSEESSSESGNTSEFFESGPGSETESDYSSVEPSGSEGEHIPETEDLSQANDNQLPSTSQLHPQDYAKIRDDPCFM